VDGSASTLPALTRAEQPDELYFFREDELERQCARLQRRVLHSARLGANHSARIRQRATKRVVFLAIRLWAKAQAVPRDVISATHTAAAERAFQVRAETDGLRQRCIERIFKVRQRSLVLGAFAAWSTFGERRAWKQQARAQLARERELQRNIARAEVEHTFEARSEAQETRLRNMSARLFLARSRLGEVRIGAQGLTLLGSCWLQLRVNTLEARRMRDTQAWRELLQQYRSAVVKG